MQIITSGICTWAIGCKYLNLYSEPGVQITTHQLTKCKWNLELASNFLNLLASLANVFSPLGESFFPC
jgi:hypothetical protein